MPVVETESLVLKSFNLAEADRIVVFLTRDSGMVRGVAKGAKRLQSRFGSMLEPFSTVNLEYFQKEDRELVSIRHLDLVRSCFDQASEPEVLQTFSYIADLLISFVPPHDPNETLYRMVKACIDSGCSSPPAIAAIRMYFETWLLRLGGYLPNWNVCNSCKKELNQGESADVQADFHLLCNSCRRSHPNQTISGLHRDAFRNAQKLSPQEFMEYSSERTNILIDVSQILRHIISNVIGRELAVEKSFAINS
ncbi:MAG: DNA repair protein RecO [Pyrinomonadaceae bacterium]